MTLGWIAFVLSWVPQLAAVFRISGVNWVAITSGVLTVGFAYWVIVDLYVKVESKPMLLLRREGDIVLLEYPFKKESRDRFEYYWDVLIVNSSPDKTLGIIDIKLRLKYRNETKFISPYIGIPQSEYDDAKPVKEVKEGVISSPIWLRPCESKEGILAFVEERSGKEEAFGEYATVANLGEASIVITDAQKRTYVFLAHSTRKKTRERWFRQFLLR